MDPRSPRLDFDLVADRRARVVRATMVPAAVVMTTMGAFYASLGLWDLVVSYGLAICGALLALGLAHRGQVASAAQVGATAALSATLVDTLATGGLEGPGAAYLGLPPLIAAATSGRTSGAAWLGLVLICIVGLGLLEPIAVRPELVAVAPTQRQLTSVMLVASVGAGTLYANRQTHRLNRELTLALANADRASTQKDRLLANVSHHLRTPLTTIVGYTELVAEEGADPSTRGDLERIQLSSRSLLAIIDDILDVARVGAGEIVLTPGPVALPELVEELRATVEPLAHSGGNVTRFDVEELARPLRHDEGRLRQVLLNLLGNACKFTRDGEVALEVRADADQIYFEVRDTGIGMTPEEQARVFDEFEQANDETAEQYGGAGLGLAISRRLVTAMGGTLELRSELGRGSTFTVTLPWSVA